MPHHAKTLLRIVFCAAALAVCTASFAHAEVECSEPMANWQPVAKLVEQVTAQGWTVVKVRADDGCYHLRATDRDGKPVQAIFDPVSLRLLATGTGQDDDHEHDQHGHSDVKHAD